MGETSGLADFVFEGKTYKTWYKVIGNLKSGRTPVVTLHGGPGATSQYMMVNKFLWELAEIPVVIYDQIGNGQSTHIPDAPKGFWTPELFMDELDNLLKFLGIQDDFVLLGQSFGGALTAQYAATKPERPHLNGLKKLVIYGAPSSLALFQAGVNKLLNQFPEDYIKSVRKHEADGTFGSEEYQKLAGAFYAKHICHLDPWPEDLKASYTAMLQNPTVFHALLGPSVYSIIGSLKTWDISDKLHNISVPTLIISGEHDQVQPEAVAAYSNLVKQSKWVMFSNSSHSAAYEEPEKYTNTVLEFLTDA